MQQGEGATEDGEAGGEFSDQKGLDQAQLDLQKFHQPRDQQSFPPPKRVVPTLFSWTATGVATDSKVTSPRLGGDKVASACDALTCREGVLVGFPSKEAHL